MNQRNDLTFMTLVQLAGAVRGDWDERPIPAIAEAQLTLLDAVDYPDEDNGLLLIELVLIMKTLLSQLRGWKTPYSVLIKKELLQRINEYESMLVPPPTPRELVING